MERAAVEADRAQSRFLGHDLTGRFRRDRSAEQVEAARRDMDHAQVCMPLWHLEGTSLAGPSGLPSRVACST